MEFLLSPRSILEMYRYMDDSIMRAWICFLFGLLCQFFFVASSKRVSNLHQHRQRNNCWTVVAVEPGTVRKNTEKLWEQISATMDRKIGVRIVVCVLSRCYYFNEIFKVLNWKKDKLYFVFIYNFFIIILWDYNLIFLQNMYLQRFFLF